MAGVLLPIKRHIPPAAPQSLTFSASDDAYLFAPAVAHGALEHVNGTVLFSSQGSAGSASHGGGPCACGGLESRSWSPLPDWAEPSAAAQPGPAAQACWVLGQARQVPRKQAAPPTAVPLTPGRTSSPGRLVALVPAACVPAPPLCSAAAQAEPAESAFVPDGPAAMLCQQLHQAAAQCPPLQRLCPSPFAFYSAGRPAGGPASACLL